MPGLIDETKDRKRKKLESLYASYLSLLIYEGNLVSTRFGHVIATQTIFFGAYFVTTTSQYLTADVKHVVQLLISACAIASLFVYALILARTSVSATSWRASLSLIEQDDDFWHPHGRSEFQDLDIFCSRSRAADGTETRQQHTIHGITSHRFKILLWMGNLVRDPTDFYAIYFPAFFFVVWLSFSVTSNTHVSSPIIALQAPPKIEAKTASVPLIPSQAKTKQTGR